MNSDSREVHADLDTIRVMCQGSFQREIGSEHFPGSSRGFFETRPAPVILDGELFQIVEENGNLIQAQCQTCPPTKKPIRGSRWSTGNFISHLMRCHPHLKDRLQEKRNGIRRGRSSGANRQINTQEQQAERHVVSVNQPMNPQSKVNDLISNYLIEEMRPISTVDQPSFQLLILGISSNPSITIPTKEFLEDALKSRYQFMLQNMTWLLANIEYVCTTVHIVTSRDRSYLVMTLHYLDSDNLSRKSLLLAYQPVSSEDPDLKQIFQVYSHFNLGFEKITNCVTSDMVDSEIFPCWGGAAKTRGSDSISSIDTDQIISCDYWDSTVIVEEELKKHFAIPFMANSVNLIASVDPNDEPFYKDTGMKAFYKMTNFFSFVSQAPDDIAKTFGFEGPIELPMSWISFYNNLSIVLLQRDKLGSCFETFGLDPFKCKELEFLNDYKILMEPVATAMEILRGDSYSYLGSVLPTIFIMEKKIKSLDTHCTSLRAKILEGISTRFADVTDLGSPDSKPFIIAAISHPKFKLSWVPVEKLQVCKDFFITECENVSKPNEEVPVLTQMEASGSSTGVDEFFTCLNDDQSSKRCHLSSIQALTYLEDRNRSLESLQLYPLIKQIFIKYNTTLPSSAPIEKIFYNDNTIVTPKTNNLSDGMFEMLMMLKFNFGNTL